MLQWTGLWIYPVIGFNAAGLMYSNHPYSFRSDTNDIACLSPDQSNFTHIIFKISSEPSVVQLRQQFCWSWYFSDIGMHGSVKQYFTLLPSCPCTLFQARYDLRWELYHIPRSNINCYLYRFPTRFDVCQLCCYLLPDGEAILQGAFSGGSLLFYPPNYAQFYNNEYLPKFHCCSYGLCHIFEQRRPFQTCDDYKYEIQISGKNYKICVLSIEYINRLGLG